MKYEIIKQPNLLNVIWSKAITSIWNISSGINILTTKDPLKKKILINEKEIHDNYHKSNSGDEILLKMEWNPNKAKEFFNLFKKVSKYPEYVFYVLQEWNFQLPYKYNNIEQDENEKYSMNIKDLIPAFKNQYKEEYFELYKKEMWKFDYIQDFNKLETLSKELNVSRWSLGCSLYKTRINTNHNFYNIILEEVK